MYISNHKYTIERMPEAYGASRWYIFNFQIIFIIFTILIFILKI